MTYLFHNLENQGLLIIAASETRNARKRPLARLWEYGSPGKKTKQNKKCKCVRAKFIQQPKDTD